MTLEDLLCVQKVVMRDSLQGEGTSYSKDPKNYTENQLKCYRCLGIETHRECYWSQSDYEGDSEG